MQIQVISKTITKTIYFGDMLKRTYEAILRSNGRQLKGYGHTHARAIQNLLNQL